MTLRVAFDARTLAGDRTGIGRYMTGLLSAPAMAQTVRNSTLISNRSGAGLDLGAAKVSVVGAWAPPPIWEQIVLPRAIANSEADVYHIPHEGGPRRLGKRRFVATIYDLIPLRLPELYMRNKAHAFYYHYKLATLKRYADAIITASSFSYNELHELLGIDYSRLHLIPTPPDASFAPMSLAEASEVLSSRGLPHQFILSIGSREPRKNLVTVLRAYAALRESSGFGSPPSLVLFGADWRGRGIEDIVAKLGLADAVLILGRVSERELSALYSAAICIVYGSSFEGYGLPILEAMACGCPVITTNASSLPEVADGAAILVDPFAIDAMTDAIGSLATDAALRNEYREKGLARVSRLSWDRTARATLKVFEG